MFVPSQMGPWPHMAFFWLENRSKTTRRAFFPGVDAIKRLPPDQHRSPEAGKACAAVEKYILCFSGRTPFLPQLCIEHRVLWISPYHGTSRSVSQRPQLETHIRRVIKNTFSNVNCVLGWELFPGFKITTVNRNVMFQRACVSPFLFTWW